jgi:hypothetical protein
MGYSQIRGLLIVQVSRTTKARFVGSYAEAEWVRGLGGAAFATRAGLEVWKNGIAVGLYGSYLLANPDKGLALARAALSRL